MNDKIPTIITVDLIILASLVVVIVWNVFEIFSSTKDDSAKYFEDTEKVIVSEEITVMKLLNACGIFVFIMRGNSCSLIKINYFYVYKMNNFYALLKSHLCMPNFLESPQTHLKSNFK